MRTAEENVIPGIVENTTKDTLSPFSGPLRKERLCLCNLNDEENYLNKFILYVVLLKLIFLTKYLNEWKEYVNQTLIIL